MKNLSLVEQKVYNYIEAEGGQNVKISLRKFATACNISHQTIKNAVETMIAAGVLNVNKGRGRGNTNTYSLTSNNDSDLKAENEILKNRIDKAIEIYYKMSARIQELEQLRENNLQIAEELAERMKLLEKENEALKKANADLSSRKIKKEEQLVAYV